MTKAESNCPLKRREKAKREEEVTVSLWLMVVATEISAGAAGTAVLSEPDGIVNKGRH